MTLKALLFAALFLPLIAGQIAKSPRDTLTVDANLVSIRATVRDRNGQLVSDLTQDNFVLRQDGNVQPIRYFTKGADAPLSLVLLVDTSDSQTPFLRDEMTASKLFFEEMIQGKEDRAGLVQFGDIIIQLQDMTHSVEALKRSLGYIADPPKSISDASRARRGTKLYDAMRASIDLTLHDASDQPDQRPRRRVMLVLTDGLDNHSDGTIQDVVRDAQRNDVAIYAIRYGRQYETQTVLGHTYYAPDAEAVLKKLTLPTGGRVFPSAYGQEALTKVYEAIRQDLQSQYRMEYVPPKSKPGKYHSIYLRAKCSRMTVYAREGYYSQQ